MTKNIISNFLDFSEEYNLKQLNTLTELLEYRKLIIYLSGKDSLYLQRLYKHSKTLEQLLFKFEWLSLNFNLVKKLENTDKLFEFIYYFSKLSKTQIMNIEEFNLIRRISIDTFINHKGILLNKCSPQLIKIYDNCLQLDGGSDARLSINNLYSEGLGYRAEKALKIISETENILNSFSELEKLTYFGTKRKFKLTDKNGFSNGMTEKFKDLLKYYVLYGTPKLTLGIKNKV